MTPDSSQNRENAAQTESERFHMNALNNIIEQIQPNSSATISDSIRLSNSANSSAFEQPQNKKPRKKFDLNQFISNAVYPAECPTDDDLNLTGTLLNASFQINHLRTPMQSETSEESVDLDETLVSQNLDETIVDEELVWNLSQKVPASGSSLNDTLTPGDYEILEIWRQLEEQEDNDEAGLIEEDSMLAPLTQSSIQQKLSQHQSQEVAPNASMVAVDRSEEDPFKESADEANQTNPKRSNVFAEEYFNDSDDDLLNEFSTTLDIEEFL